MRPAVLGSGGFNIRERDVSNHIPKRGEGWIGNKTPLEGEDKFKGTGAMEQG